MNTKKFTINLVLCSLIIFSLVILGVKMPSFALDYETTESVAPDDSFYGRASKYFDSGNEDYLDGKTNNLGETTPIKWYIKGDVVDDTPIGGYNTYVYRITNDSSKDNQYFETIDAIIMYCLEKDKASIYEGGVSAQMKREDFTYSALNSGYAAIVKKGYNGTKDSAKALGFDSAKDDEYYAKAYFVTQKAVWLYNHYVKNTSSFDLKNYFTGVSAGNPYYDAIVKLFNLGKDAYDTYKTPIKVTNISLKSARTLDLITDEEAGINYYSTGKITVDFNLEGATDKQNIIKNKLTYKVTDSKGKEINSSNYILNVKDGKIEVRVLSNYFSDNGIDEEDVGFTVSASYKSSASTVYTYEPQNKPGGTKYDEFQRAISALTTTSYTKDEEEFTYTVPDTKIVISKIDGADGTCLSGAILNLEDSEGNVLYTWESSTSNVTNASDEVLVDCDKEVINLKDLGLGAGTYYIKEIEAPNGYELLEEPQEIIINKGEEKIITIKNNKIVIVPITDRNIPTIIYIFSSVILVSGGLLVYVNAKRKKEIQ